MDTLESRTPDEIEVIHGNDLGERRLGLLLPPENAVCAAPVFEDKEQILDDSDIKKLIQDPNRTPRKVIFKDQVWVKKGDQKSHGSCNGFATSSVFSKVRYLSGLNDMTVFSGSYVYSWINGGRDQGSALVDDINQLNQHGLVSVDKCTADMIYRNQTSKFDEEAKTHAGINGYQIKTKQGFRTALAKGWLVVVAVQVDRTKFVNFKGTGIVPAFNGRGNHAIHADDISYYKGTEVYDVVNNWGLGWATEGRGIVTWDSFAQTFSTHQFWALCRNLSN